MNSIGQLFARGRDNAACVPANCINGKCKATGECVSPPWPKTDREYAKLALVEAPPLAPGGGLIGYQGDLPESFRPSPRTIIAFTGLAGSGKSTAAAHLVNRRGFVRVRFAGPLKAMLAALGCTPAEIDGDRKELPCDLLGGATPRHAMQTLGTEWGRNLIAPDLWIRAWQHALSQVPAGVPVVVDDCRFPNEAEVVAAAGGIIVRIHRPGAGTAAAGHTSEGQALHRSRTLHNTVSVQNLREQVDVMLADLSWADRDTHATL